MTTVFEPAYAKLNLTLDVIGLRPDGYHDLQSIMQTVSLCDDITIDIDTGDGWKLVCDAPGIPTDSRNLAWKAAAVFFESTGIETTGITIHIYKRIPSQAGMGGGSSNAAAVLRALNRHYGSPLTNMELAALGAKIGSDVPFCVVGGTVMCEGRGEILRPIQKMPNCLIVVCKPEFSMSTPVLYRTLDASVIESHPDNAAMEQAIDEGNIVAISKLLENVFDPVVANAFPLMNEIRKFYMEFGAFGCQMSGSGSSFFGIMPDRASAYALMDKLNTVCNDVFLTEPV